MEILPLLSVYEEEDHMLNAAIDSVRMLGHIFVFEGTTQSNKNELKLGVDRRQTPNNTQFVIYHGEWKSDADKRTDILKEAQAWNEDAWGLWLDGDEILLFGEYLSNHCIRAEQETATGGTTIRLVEYDGSVVQCYGKLIRLGNIEKYLMSSYEVKLQNGVTVALPNVPICTAGGIPVGDIKDRDDPLLALNRPPLIGEPHLLHRHGLRNPEREAPRLHDKEAEDFENLVQERN